MQMPRELRASARLPHPSPPANTQPHPLLLSSCTGAKHFAFPNEHGKTEAKQKREQKRDQTKKKKKKKKNTKGRRKTYSKGSKKKKKKKKDEL